MKTWIEIVKEVFPHAEILDAALEYPRKQSGWDIKVPANPWDCDFDDPDYHLFVNLQDMLTADELIRLNDHFVKKGFPTHRVTVFVWAKRIQQCLLEPHVNIVNFSSHQYETWCGYKANETELRRVFATDKKDFKYNFVCPQRIYKPHRAAIHSVLSKYSHANISLQSKGKQLVYPSLSFEEYDKEYNNLNNLLAMAENYNTALFSIVSESQYREQYGIITEKTFNSIVAGVPFLLVAHQGALVDLSEYGFVSFPTIFDETYDGLDNRVRIKDLITSNSSYIREPLTAAEMQHTWSDFEGACEYNRDYFFGQFGDQLISELRMDLLALWGD